MLPAEGATLLANRPQVAAPGVAAVVRRQPAGASSQSLGAASTFPPDKSQQCRLAQAQAQVTRGALGMWATRCPHCARRAGVLTAPPCTGPCARPGAEPSLGQLGVWGTVTGRLFFSDWGQETHLFSKSESRAALCQELFLDSEVNHTDKNPTLMEQNLGVGGAGCRPPHCPGSRGEAQGSDRSRFKSMTNG